MNASESLLPRRERNAAPLAPGARALVDAWLGRSGEGAAALALAGGDPLAAAAVGGTGMRALAEGRLEDALRWSRSRPGSAAKSLVGAETLIAGGRIVPGMDALERLVRRRDPAGTLAFARRCHLLGDHARAEAAAARMPLNPAAALIGARSALVAGRAGSALAHLHPFLAGEAATADPVQAGAIGVAAASALARLKRTAALAAFGRRLLSQGLVPPEMLPALARVAWTAGLAAQARERLAREPSPWRDAARLELDILSGDAEGAAARAEVAGTLAAPSRGMLALLTGEVPNGNGGAAEPFSAGRTLEVWRTHPVRWDPWIEAAKRTRAAVVVANLAEGVLPPDGSTPDLVLDDGALVELVEPAPVPPRAGDGDGVWVDSALCDGVGIGHDWPQEEHQALVRAARRAAAREDARVRIVSADTALATGPQGLRDIVLAPPGDPFWAGPLAERAWPAMHVVRAHPETGWRGMGSAIGALARELAGMGS